MPSCRIKNLFISNLKLTCEMSITAFTLLLTDGQYRVIRAKNVNNYNGGNNGHTQRAQSVENFCLAFLAQL